MNDLANRVLERSRQALHVLLSLFGGMSFSLGLLGFEFFDFNTVGFEDLDRSCHLPNFVATAYLWHVHLKVGGG